MQIQSLGWEDALEEEKGPRLLGKRADSRAGAWKNQDEPGAFLWCQKVRKHPQERDECDEKAQGPARGSSHLPGGNNLNHKPSNNKPGL